MTWLPFPSPIIMEGNPKSLIRSQLQIQSKSTRISIILKVKLPMEEITKRLWSCRIKHHFHHSQTIWTVENLKVQLKQGWSMLASLLANHLSFNNLECPSALRNHSTKDSWTNLKWDRQAWNLPLVHKQGHHFTQQLWQRQKFKNRISRKNFRNNWQKYSSKTAKRRRTLSKNRLRIDKNINSQTTAYNLKTWVISTLLLPLGRVWK